MGKIIITLTAGSLVVLLNTLITISKIMNSIDKGINNFFNLVRSSVNS